MRIMICMSVTHRSRWRYDELVDWEMRMVVVRRAFFFSGRVSACIQLSKWYM